jgi:hypothetical protein
MIASYSGYKYAVSKQEAIDNVRAEYRRNKDDRAGWNISAVEVDENEEKE